MMEFDLIVVGGGLIGLATAYKYSSKFPEAKIAVLEKEKKLTFHQSGRNSGVIHSGIYYKPGSYKAKNCMNGREQLVAFCKENEVYHDICGKVILATDEEEYHKLPGLKERGETNGLDQIKLLDMKEVKEIEPFVEGVGGLFIPQTGIVDFKGMARKMADHFLSANTGNKLYINERVRGIKDLQEGKQITGTNVKLMGKKVVFCGGLQSDTLAEMDGVNPEMRIVGFRGDYYELSKQGREKVRNLIYPVPDPEVPFLGVHFTRMYDGSVECGPNAVFSFKREGYSKLSFDSKDTLNALSYPGTWKLFMRHMKYGIGEYSRAFSKPLFLKALQKMIPSLTMQDLVTGRAGVRAQAVSPDGKMIDDFKWAHGKKSLHVLNAPSPAATACLAIADEILVQLEKIN